MNLSLSYYAAVFFGILALAAIRHPAQAWVVIQGICYCIKVAAKFVLYELVVNLRSYIGHYRPARYRLM